MKDSRDATNASFRAILGIKDQSKLDRARSGWRYQMQTMPLFKTTSAFFCKSAYTLCDLLI